MNSVCSQKGSCIRYYRFGIVSLGVAIINDLVGAHMYALGLCHKLGHGIGHFLKRAFFGSVSLLLTTEAVSFFDTFIFFCHGQLIDTYGINIYCIWVMLATTCLVSLCESPPVLLSFWVQKLESGFVISFLEHPCTLHQCIATCFLTCSFFPGSEHCQDQIFHEDSLLHGLV